MTDLLDKGQRAGFAIGGAMLVALASVCALAGFALSGIWPGLSWAIGAALGFVLLLPAARWLRAAITGRRPRVHRDAERRGTI